jgi:acyl carrier protein
MNDEQILSIIREALHEVAPNRTADFEAIRLDTTIETLGLDSIATMEMVGFIEEKVDATFADEELAKVTALEDIAGMVRSAA